MAEGIEVAGRVLADRVRWARSWRERSDGLLRSEPLRDGEALVIEPARQVHTIGMTYPIDVVFCDRKSRVRHVVRRLAPQRITRVVFGARFAIELPAGVVPVVLERGARVRISPSRSGSRG